MGFENIASHGAPLSPLQTLSGHKLKNGRDLHQSCWPVEDLYRAIDKNGDTVDFLLTAARDQAAAWRYLERAINRPS
jgi:hypothetical protein